MVIRDEVDQSLFGIQESEVVQLTFDFPSDQLAHDFHAPTICLRFDLTDQECRLRAMTRSRRSDHCRVMIDLDERPTGIV